MPYHIYRDGDRQQHHKNNGISPLLYRMVKEIDTQYRVLSQFHNGIFVPRVRDVFNRLLQLFGGFLQRFGVESFEPVGQKPSVLFVGHLLYDLGAGGRQLFYFVQCYGRIYLVDDYLFEGNLPFLLASEQLFQQVEIGVGIEYVRVVYRLVCQEYADR